MLLRKKSSSEIEENNIKNKHIKKMIRTKTNFLNKENERRQNNYFKENLIWITTENNQYEIYQKLIEINSINVFNIFPFNDIDTALDNIIKIKFSSTIIIIDGEIIDLFFPKLYQNIGNLYTIPKILIFTKEQFHNLQKYESYPFFKIEYVFTNYMKLKREILKNYLSKYFSTNNSFVFEYIKKPNELVIPINYKKFINEPKINEINSFNQLLYQKFILNNKVTNLLSPALEYNVPTQLLIKYWLRLLTIPSFEKVINENLLIENGNNFEILTQVLYMGLKKKYIQPCINKKLFRGGILKQKELNEIKENKKYNVNNETPNLTCFNKIYLTFSTDEKYALTYMDNQRNFLEEDEELVFFEIEEGENIDVENASNTDIQNYSLNSEIHEILFFPFSYFEVSEISTLKNTNYESNDDYNYIKLKYLGKYKVKFSNLAQWKNIGDSKFVNNIIKTNIFDKNGLERIYNENPKVFSYEILKKYFINRKSFIKQNNNNTANKINTGDNNNIDNNTNNDMNINNNDNITDNYNDNINNNQNVKNKKKWYLK